MNIAQLEYLVEVTKEESIASVAKKLYLTPQAVSKSIGELERELGVKLLVKSGRGIAPTNIAWILAEKAKEILDDIASFKLLANSYGEEYSKKHHLRLGVSVSPYRGCIYEEDGLKKFESEHKDGLIEFVLLPSDACFAALNSGIVDAAIMTGRLSWDGCSSFYLYSVKPRVVISRSSELASGEFIFAGELKGYSIARPTDFHNFHVKLIEFLRCEGVNNPVFADAGFTLESHKSFLDEKGVIFVANAPEVVAAYPDECVVLDVVGRNLWEVPISLAFREDSNFIFLHHLRSCLRSVLSRQVLSSCSVENEESDVLL